MNMQYNFYGNTTDLYTNVLERAPVLYSKGCWRYWDISVMPNIESYLTLLMTLFVTQLNES
jgi:hypothetical protein